MVLLRTTLLENEHISLVKLHSCVIWCGWIDYSVPDVLKVSSSVPAGNWRSVWEHLGHLGNSCLFRNMNTNPA